MRSKLALPNRHQHRSELRPRTVSLKRSSDLARKLEGVKVRGGTHSTRLHSRHGDLDTAWPSTALQNGAEQYAAAELSCTWYPCGLRFAKQQESLSRRRLVPPPTNIVACCCCSACRCHCCSVCRSDPAVKSENRERSGALELLRSVARRQITQWIRNEEERLSSSRLAGAGSA